MNTNDVYAILCAKGAVTLTGSMLELDNLRRRLISKKYRENRALGDFADKSVQLKFTWVQEETPTQEAKLRIELEARASEFESVQLVTE